MAGGSNVNGVRGGSHPLKAESWAAANSWSHAVFATLYDACRFYNPADYTVSVAVW